METFFGAASSLGLRVEKFSCFVLKNWTKLVQEALSGRKGMVKKGVSHDFEYKKLLNINMCSSHKILKSFIALYMT